MLKKGKSSISKGKSYREIGEFWDTHDLGEFWDKTKDTEFEVDIQFKWEKPHPEIDRKNESQDKSTL